MVSVVCIEDTDDIAASASDTFVHRIIYTVVWFSNEDIDAVVVVLDNFRCLVCRSSVNDDHFEIGNVPL